MAYSCRHSLFALFLEYAANVTPEFDQIDHCLWSKNIAYAHLPLALQLRKMSIQLIFRNSFTTVELIDTGSNLCVNRSSVFQKPAIPFFLSLHQTEQTFLDAAGTARPEQLLDSGLKGRDFALKTPLYI
jgi:hypothetical protein